MAIQGMLTMCVNHMLRKPLALLTVLIVVGGTLDANAQTRPRDLKQAPLASGVVRSEAGDEPTCEDADGDGYGSPGDASCDNGAAEDCDDSDAEVNPGASEACDGTNTKCCNGVDDNCDGQVDENVTAFTRDGDPGAVCFGGERDTQSCAVPADCPGGNCQPGSKTYLSFLDLPIGAACAPGAGC